MSFEMMDSLRRNAVATLANSLAFERSFVTLYDQFGREIPIVRVAIGETTKVRMPFRFAKAGKC